MGSRVLRSVAALATVCLSAGLLGLTTAPEAAQAADLRSFQPGNIISDQAFYDSSSMSVADIQAFLNSKAPSCVGGPDGSPCLKNFRSATGYRAPDAKCAGAYSPSSDEGAAEILYKVGQACGISPRVLLVMLQKEQGLVTASGSSLTERRYRVAMGYGCPDTAPCDTLYYGFANQVYSAAAQFRNYRNNPTRFGYQAGRTVNVLYNPNAACGSAALYLQNQATAGLYNYTPYQPNPAALAAGYGVGDGCSAYGNRNFYSYFTDWFGTGNNSDPIGHIDSVTTGPTSVRVAGWVLDADSNDPTDVHVYVDSAGQALTADRDRPDVQTAFGRGSLHGFDVTIAAPPGQHNVCAYAINAPTGANPSLGCQTVMVTGNRTPIGTVDSVAVVGNQVTVNGWALDPDSNDSIPVHIYLDAGGAAFTADRPRPDVAAVFGQGAASGFQATLTAPVGTHTVCAYAINTPIGSNPALGCRSVTVIASSNSSPVGSVDTFTVVGDQVTVAGWALDPDTNGPIQVRVAVGSAETTISADLDRPDVASAFGRGAAHGYQTTLTAPVGSVKVCITAINQLSGTDTVLGCRVVTVASPNAAPIGNFESFSIAANQVTVNGWALDPDTDDPVQVSVSVGSATVSVAADQQRADVAAALGKGSAHGFRVSATARIGSNRVCVTAIDRPAGQDTILGCVTVQITTTANVTPIGNFESATVAGDQVTVSGWALDPDTSEPIPVHVYVNSAGFALTADQPRPDVQAALGLGPDHGFQATVTIGPGSNRVCVYAINVPTGANPTLGCTSVSR